LKGKKASNTILPFSFKAYQIAAVMMAKNWLNEDEQSKAGLSNKRSTKNKIR